MSVSMETQRLISVSLGKIAQSRGQRGGINLHKNLLVATVLHKARNAYMIESYSYQQNLHRQKILEQYQLQQNVPGEKLESSPLGEVNKGETCPVSGDCHLGQPGGGVTLTKQSSSDVSSESVTLIAHEPISDLDAEIVQDKENSPPSGEDCHFVPANKSELMMALAQDIVSAGHQSQDSHIVSAGHQSQDSHIVSAVQLSQDAQMTSCDQNWKQTLTSGGTTCNVLKRRRDNPSASLHESECPASKTARLQQDTPSTTSSTNFSADCSDESRSNSQMSHNSDSHQILNLVNIFNSGFSGLCSLTSNSELHASSYQSDFDISSSQLHTRKIATKAG